MKEKIRFILNGEQVEVQVERNQTLLWILRNYFNLTGTKYGCGMGYCGVCTVLLDDEPVRSCGIAMEDVAGKKVLTIEGIAKDGELHPLQQALVDHDALQCGYCTPGMIMNAYGLLLRNPRPTRDEIIAGMDDNYCRCAAHTRIVDAIESIATGQKK